MLIHFADPFPEGKQSCAPFGFQGLLPGLSAAVNDGSDDQVPCLRLERCHSNCTQELCLKCVETLQGIASTLTVSLHRLRKLHKSDWTKSRSTKAGAPSLQSRDSTPRVMVPYIPALSQAWDSFDQNLCFSVFYRFADVALD